MGNLLFKINSVFQLFATYFKNRSFLNNFNLV